MKLSRVVVGVVSAFAVAAVANIAFLTWPALNSKSQDPRNKKVGLYTYYRYGVDPRSIVLDLWSLSPEAAMVDVDRVLFDTAEVFKDREYSEVFLAYHGDARFILDGKYFKKLGEERKWQNPVYTIRTLTENVKQTDGGNAFSTWTGGLLGVMNKQMEDHSDFHRQWYLKDL
ncbi:hypothetical protein GUK30_14165 [Rhizobium leguminosarum]|uniref:hypothetical protein n=1 Tax=Rhizobium ruizarguesonis TaxID=2081791 RepID=UPI0013C128F1|nr:hypothetical protein [Rhizobium ruizarguesonis]NEI20555.1 hypothetical protein [Rhizobium ruizarguesonis]